MRTGHQSELSDGSGARTADIASSAWAGVTLLDRVLLQCTYYLYLSANA